MNATTTSAPVLVRSNYLGGMGAGKWHIVRDRSDHAALCGHEHTSVGRFSNELSPNDSQTPQSLYEWASSSGYVCKRCSRRIS